ncbi:hypothetical protein ACFVUS_31215 [Nocardia sp. NPDC058058]|uniref:hypothetical protein n=1 Tax=Nocardia sp. NPDC058058 TaxID=3346317 RepID=UPI0036DD9838
MRENCLLSLLDGDGVFLCCTMRLTAVARLRAVPLGYERPSTGDFNIGEKRSMKLRARARSTVGIAAVTAIGVATVVSATAASADMTVTPSQAYCVRTDYTITLPAADAAVLETNPTYDQIILVSSTEGTKGSMPWISGEDWAIDWMPLYAGQTTLTLYPYSVALGFGSPALTSGPINVVPSAPLGASCLASPSAAGPGTGSASPF